MLNKLQKPNREGFTIIEVMIVLAIAGLIILIVLLAVPALQRNSRNTAIKNDASAIASGITEFASNNDGASIKADKSSAADGVITLDNGVSGSSKTTAKVQGGTTVTFKSSQAPNSSTIQDPGNIQVLVGYSCNGTVGARSVAIEYSIETGSGKAYKCLDT